MRREWSATLAVIAAALAVAARAHAVPRAPDAPSCTSAEHREFDFFAGDWDAFDVADPSRATARNHVTPMLGGCALREVYEQRDGLSGESFSTYDAVRRVWHQSWVTNRGQLLLLEGRLEHGRMVLTATDRASTGAPSLLRAVWYVVPDGVRETATRSTDGGRTWTPVFDIAFRPHR
ncbi:MAG: hypothetical protein JO180_08620 [Gemmatirosa sp.]|nr:hypothetical protein [Gemmatirosa sp.]